MPEFDYQNAFIRNRGLVKEREQERLRKARIAVIGAGGVGGLHAVTLARMGVGNFRLVDPDTFDLANFNRQVGAVMSTLGRPKASVTAEQIHEIDPEAGVDVYDVALDASNVDEILADVDLVVDAVDFFSPDVRILVYTRCEQRGIPVVTSGPIGMSTTMHVFAPGGMPFERYFDFRPGMSRVDKLAGFLAGVAPRASQRPYMDVHDVKIAGEYGPSLAASCTLCAGVVGIETLRVLLGWPGLRLAPHWYQFDAYRRRFYSGYLWFGNRHPLQRLKRWLIKRMLSEMADENRSE